MAMSFEETLQKKLNDIVSSVQQEEKRLKAEWQAIQADRAAMEAELKSKAAHLEEERAAFEAKKEMKEMIVVAKKEVGSKVKLDVGGTTSHSSRTKLASTPGPTPEATFLGHQELEEDEDGRVAIGSSESSLGAPQLQGFDSSKDSGVSAVDQRREVISPPLSAGPAQAPLPVGLLFPESSTVRVTMMSGVKEIPAVKDMLKKASSILGFDLLRLCREGPEHMLLDGPNRECALYVACLAGLEKLRNEREEAVARAQAMAGINTGELVALKAAGTLSFEDGLKLAKSSGEAWREAALAGGQADLYVAGLHKPKLAELCAQAAKKEGAGAVCQISQDIFPLGFCAAGTERSILELKGLAEKAGALHAKVTGRVAHYTPLLKPLEARLNAILDEVLPNMSPPRTTVYMNATGAPIRPGTNPADIVKLLKKRVTSPLLWGASINGMIEAGISEFYDVGPGSNPSDIMKHQNAKVWRRGMTNIDV